MTASIWAPAGFSPEIVPFRTFEYTVDLPTDTFSISPYTALYQNQIKVFQNGEILQNATWVISGTNVVLSAPAAADSKIRIDVYVEAPFGEGGGGGTTLPALEAGKFLTNDGTLLSWATIITGGAGSLNGIDLTAAPYSADSTGVTDIATAMNAAFTACPDGGMIVLRAGGTYKWSSSLMNNKNVIIYAEGATINFTSPDGAIRKTLGENTVIVVGGTWIGAATASAIKYVRAIDSVNQYRELLVTKASFKSYDAFAIHLEGTREVAITDSAFTTDAASVVALSGGVYGTRANNPYMLNCQFYGRGKGYASLMDGAGDPSSANPIWDNCVIMGWQHGIKVVGCDDGHITKCTIDYNSLSNITLSSQDAFTIANSYIGTGNNNPALIITSEGALGLGPDQCRFITVEGNHFVGHETVGNLCDLIQLTGPSSAYYPDFVQIKNNHFQAYTRRGISFATIARLDIAGNSFQPVLDSEPTTAAVYNVTGTGDSFVAIYDNQFPNPTTLAGANLQSARLWNNRGYDGGNGAASIISQYNGFTGIGGYGSSYWHHVKTTGPEQWDRYSGVPTRRMRRAGGSLAVPTAVGNTDVVSSLIGDGHNGAAFYNVASLQFLADGAQTATSSPGRARIAVTPAGTQNMVSAFEVTNNGDICLNPTAVANSGRIYFGGADAASASLGLYYGTGNPEGSITAKPGSIYLSTSGSLYTKSSGTGNTGWVAGSGGSFSTSYVFATTCSTSFSGGGALTLCQFTSEVTDTLAEWDGNTFQAASAGFYHISASIAITGTTMSLNEQVRVDIYKNGTRLLAGQSVPSQGSISAFNSTTSINAHLQLAAGDTIRFYVFNNASGGSVSGNGNAIATWATIMRTK